MEKKNTGLDKLRNIVKEEVLKEMEEQQKARAMHDVIVDIAKAAATGMKAISTLKSKALPTQKATEAVTSAITALEHIFQDMSTNPTRYLDTGDPNDIVKNHLGKLNARSDALRDGRGSDPSEPGSQV